MASASDPRRAALDVLVFHAEAGVDCALDETAHDRFAPVAAAPASVDPAPSAPALLRPRATAAPPPPAALPAPDAAAAEARARAASAATLDELRVLMAAFEGCALKTTARNLVFADGNPQARLMLVGEGPGMEEDQQGLPFVGRSGQLLDRMLAVIGLDRTKVYIANVVPWRPPGNRTPTPQELVICRPFITRQIELCDPDLLVCLGLASAQTLLGIKEGITRARGRWFRYHTGRREVPALATLHPAYLLRTPSQKRLAWRDFKAIRAALREAAVTQPRADRGG